MPISQPATPAEMQHLAIALAESRRRASIRLHRRVARLNERHALGLSEYQVLALVVEIQNRYGVPSYSGLVQMLGGKAMAVCLDWARRKPVGVGSIRGQEIIRVRALIS